MSDRLKFRLKVWLWSVRNWFLGYKFGPVRRFRCCGHTTPYHHWKCLEE